MYHIGYAQPDRKDHVCCTVYHIGYAQPLLIQKKKKRKEDHLCTLQHLVAMSMSVVWLWVMETPN